MNHQREGEHRYLLRCLKALADDTRLRMISTLASGEHSVQALADKIGVRAPTVSHHIAKLRAVGFLTLRIEGKQHFLSLNAERLAAFKELIERLEQIEPDETQSDSAWIDALPLEDWEKKVLRDYTFAGRLRQIPRKEKKYLAVLNWLALSFEEGRIYSELEVNEIITRYHDDYATLRRGLISYGYLRRERGGAKYWLTPGDEEMPPGELTPPRQ